MLFALTFMRFEYGEMSKFEKAKEIMNSKDDESDEMEESTDSGKNKKRKGTVLDLVVPIAVLIVFCVVGMIYSGGFFSEGDTHLDFC